MITDDNLLAYAQRIDDDPEWFQDIEIDDHDLAAALRELVRLRAALAVTSQDRGTL